MLEQSCMLPQARLPVIDVAVIVIMDDDPEIRRAIKEIVGSVGGTVLEARDEAEVLMFAKKENVRNFILDIHMGDGRDSEGLDALERLKNLDPTIYVGMLSNHAGFRELAERLDCDAFREKTPDRVSDVMFILERLLEAREVQIGGARRAFAAEGRRYLDHDDANIKVLSRLTADPEWLKAHDGMYVALVGGEVVGVGVEKMALVEDVRKRFPYDDRLIEFISMNEDVIEVWSPLDTA